MRHNYTRKSHNTEANYSMDVISRPDMPRVKEFVDHRRKTIFRNLDAYWDASLRKHIHNAWDWIGERDDV